MNLKHEIKNSEDKICCVADFVIGVFDIHKRKMIELPQDWLEAIGVHKNDNNTK